jgi:hypothetical protein
MCSRILKTTNQRIQECYGREYSKKIFAYFEISNRSSSKIKAKKRIRKAPHGRVQKAWLIGMHKKFADPGHTQEAQPAQRPQDLFGIFATFKKRPTDSRHTRFSSVAQESAYEMHGQLW